MTVMDSRLARRPRKRIETRKRLLAAARSVLLEQGLASVNVETVTDRAGYTRGAFYSNFASMNDLVFALYSDHADELLARLAEGGDRLTGIAGMITATEAVERVVRALPLDVEWFQIRVGFAAQAVHDPDIAARFAEHEAAFEESLEPVLLRSIAQAGLVPTEEASTLTRAMIAAHDGALANSFTSADPEKLRALVCGAVLTGLTKCQVS